MASADTIRRFFDNDWVGRLKAVEDTRAFQDVLTGNTYLPAIDPLMYALHQGSSRVAYWLYTQRDRLGFETATETEILNAMFPMPWGNAAAKVPANKVKAYRDLFKMLAPGAIRSSIREEQGKLYQLVASASPLQTNLLPVIYDAGVDPFWVPEDGDWSPLILAVHHGSFSMVKTLVSQGVNVNWKNMLGRSAIDYLFGSDRCHPPRPMDQPVKVLDPAAWAQSKAIFRLLVDAGADTTYLMSPSHFIHDRLQSGSRQFLDLKSLWHGLLLTQRSNDRKATSQTPSRRRRM